MPQPPQQRPSRPRRPFLALPLRIARWHSESCVAESPAGQRPLEWTVAPLPSDPDARDAAAPPGPPGARLTALKRWRAASWCILGARWLSSEVGTLCFHQPAAPIDPATVDLIDLDLSRTGSGQPLVLRRRGWIRATLLRHVAADPEMGYCQGMTFVAAVFAMAAGDQREAYHRFRAFTMRVRSLWLPGLPLLRSAMVQFAALARTRPWFKHLCAHGVDTSMYLPQPLLTLFGAWLPLATVCDCLGLLERSNLHGMVAVAIAVMDHASGRLLRRRTMDGIMLELQGLKSNAPEPERLVAGAHAVLAAAAAAPLGLRPASVSRSASADELAGQRGGAEPQKALPRRSLSMDFPGAPPWSRDWPESNWTWQEWALWALFARGAVVDGLGGTFGSAG